MTTINNPNEREINYGTGYVDIKSSTIVKLNELFVVHDEDGPVELRVEISADFNTIDKKYHEIFLNVLSSINLLMLDRYGLAILVKSATSSTS